MGIDSESAVDEVAVNEYEDGYVGLVIVRLFHVAGFDIVVA